MKGVRISPLETYWQLMKYADGFSTFSVARLPISWTSLTVEWFQLPPVSMATGYKMCVLVSSSYLAVLLVLRCTWLRCGVANVRFCITVWDSDIPGHWLASGPWNQCVWAFPILQDQIRRFLCCRYLRPFHSSPQNIIQTAMSLLHYYCYYYLFRLLAQSRRLKIELIFN